MKTTLSKCSLLLLQWTLGLTVLIEALILALSPGAAHSFANTGMPNVVRLVLAWGEIAGAVLFLVPPTVVAGARVLIAVFLLAVVVHLLHGWMNVGMLLVYSAGAFAVMTNRS